VGHDTREVDGKIKMLAGLEICEEDEAWVPPVDAAGVAVGE
jgi:hypothetical protein